MLNQSQIQQLKVASSPAVQNSQVMTPDEAKASFSAIPKQPASSYEIAMGIKKPDGSANTDKGIIPEAADQFKAGFNQTKEGANNPNLLAGLQQIGRGTLNEAGAGIRAIFSPVEAGLKVVSQLPGFHQALGALQDHVINPTANAISDNKHIQDFMQSNPHADEVFSNLLSIVSAVAGGENAPEIKTAAETAGSTIADTASKVAGKAQDVIAPVADKIKGIVTKTPEEVATNSFEQSLTDAEKSIYPKLSPTEKAGVTLKDKGGVFGNKSVPDLINDPKTKPIIESVANLPEDIKLKPNDTVAVKESKLNQGISRLHTETEGMLNQPTVKAQTAFNDATFNKYMKDNVLSKVQKEFGADSTEYKMTQKAIKTAKSSIESNDAHGVYTGRQKFSSIWESENPRTFKKAKGSFGSQLDPQTTATVEAGRDVYGALNDFNEKLLPENHPLRPRMREESNLIKAKQEMRTRSAGDLGKGTAERVLNNHPVVKAIGKKTLNVMGVGEAVNVLGH